MARDFAPIRLSIWNDPGWTSLTLEQQGFYHMLSSQTTLNLAGVLDFLPGRLARLASEFTAKRVRQLVADLQEREMVFLDEDTEELLIRSYIRTTQGWQIPNTAKAVATNVEQVMSPYLKGVLLYELRRVIDGCPNGKWEKSLEYLTRVAATLEQGGINPWVKGSGNPSANGKARDGDGEGDGEIRDGDGLTLKSARFDEEFNRFWFVYPRKVGKGKARDAFKKASNQNGVDVIISGAERLRDDPNLLDEQFIPHPTTWLNREGWHDDPYPPRNGPQEVDLWSRKGKF